MYHHSRIKSPDGQSAVEQIVSGSAAHKFFVPSLPFPEHNRPIAQDLNRIGFCIVHVRDNRIDLEYYSTEPFGAEPKTPKWELRDSFGYTFDGQQFGKPTEEKPKHVVHTRPNVGHRGASFVAPENTLASYRTAIEFGANGGECDVYRSADGILFLSHDRSPKRTMGGGEEDLTKMTFEQIRQFDAGSWKGEKFKGEKVPMLAEYLKVLKDTTCHPVIEIKQSGIEADVLECIRCYEMMDVSTIITFGEGIVREVRRLEPNIAVAWLYGEDLKDKGTAEENAERLTDFLLQRCRELDITVLDLNHGLLSPKLIKSLNEAGIHVWAWTVNDETAMRRFLDWGVESITTDKPELLAKILEERKQP
jgi:glycerophosphoryl diester phosphodiesterase